MILNRLGNKSKIADKIQGYFPRHDIYMEPFFGAGGMYFNKPKAKFNFINDLDDDVYNLFRQLIDNKEEFIKIFNEIPITDTQFKKWGKGAQEDTPVMKAVRFLFISNFGLYGKPNTLRISPTNPKKLINENIDKTLKWMQDAYFFNVDFRRFFSKCDYKSNIGRTFCYCDPPYLGTDDNYSNSFTEEDSSDLFKTLVESGVRFAMSEFDHPFILQKADEHNLNVVIIGERANIKNKRTEILVTNYENRLPLLFT